MRRRHHHGDGPAAPALLRARRFGELLLHVCGQRDRNQRGAKTNTTGAVTSNEGGAGNTATASISVLAPGPSTALVSSQNPSSAGQSVTFTATVTGASPTGTVTFKDGATAVATVAVGAGGVTSFATSSLATGTHAITATYNGDPGNLASTSAALTQIVNVPADSVRLRALQLEVTKIEAQSSGQAISGAIDGAILDRFAGNAPPLSGRDHGMHSSPRPSRNRRRRRNRPKDLR